MHSIRRSHVHDFFSTNLRPSISFFYNFSNHGLESISHLCVYTVFIHTFTFIFHMYIVVISNAGLLTPKLISGASTNIHVIRDTTHRFSSCMQALMIAPHEFGVIRRTTTNEFNVKCYDWKDTKLVKRSHFLLLYGVQFFFSKQYFRIAYSTRRCH